MQDNALVDWPTTAVILGYKDVETAREIITDAGVALVHVSERRKLPTWATSGALRAFIQARAIDTRLKTNRAAGDRAAVSLGISHPGANRAAMSRTMTTNLLNVSASPRKPPPDVDPFYVASDIKRSRRTKTTMDGIRAAIIDILEADHPQTVRQITTR